MNLQQVRIYNRNLKYYYKRGGREMGSSALPPTNSQTWLGPN